jgi:hypothetical protein
MKYVKMRVFKTLGRDDRNPNYYKVSVNWLKIDGSPINPLLCPDEGVIEIGPKTMGILEALGKSP